MSKKFSLFPNGDPPQDTDKFLLGRADGKNYTITWAQIVAAIGAPPPSASFFLLNDGISMFLLNDGVSRLQKNA